MTAAPLFLDFPFQLLQVIKLSFLGKEIIYPSNLHG